VSGNASSRRAVFLDRDGTLIEDVGYLSDPDTVEFIEGAIEGLRALGGLGFALVLVSNQSGIARGLISGEQADAVHERFVSALADKGVELDDVRYCPHGPDEGCPCRKPLPGLILDATAALGIDLERSFVVGDKDADVEAGRRAGCRTIQFGRGGGGADFTASTWSDVVEFVRRSTVAAA
jgi:D-glycero-D-manno-heptose 1,7-bisphosphate phosphatase